MARRKPLARKFFGLESLEVRNAPSHVGLISHAIAAVHPVHATAHVTHLSPAKITVRHDAPEVKTAADRSVDATRTDTSSPDTHSPSTPGSTDPSSPDASTVDRTGRS